MTILLERGAGDPDRIADAISILRPSPLYEIVEAVVAYAGTGGGAVYVECLGDQYRWSPASRGGPYPLMRLLSRFLGCDHHQLTVGFVTVDGWCIAADPEETRWDRYMILEHAPADVSAAVDLITERLPGE